MEYTLSKIAKIVEGKLVGNNATVEDLIFDSRMPFSGDKNLFFAIKSSYNDGHNYIKSLFESGVNNFVVNDYYSDIQIFKGCNFILVDNTVKSLQKLATYHRKLFDIPVVGITGSNGKTIVKEWLNYFLNKFQNSLQSPKSYNSQIGVPLSVWQLNKNHQIAVFEAGISQVNEMFNLEKIVKPDVGIFTNIGDAHQVNFKSKEEKILEKLHLFKNSKSIIYCSDFEDISNLIEKELPDIIKFTWSKNKQANVEILNISKKNINTDILLKYKDKIFTITTKYSDKASIDNILTVLSALLVIYPQKTPNDFNFLELEPVEMRLQQLEGKNNCTIINDSYNSDLTSIKIALDVLNTQNQHKNKAIILSDVFEVEKNKDETYNVLSEILNNSKIDLLIGVGETIAKYKQLFELNKAFFSSTEILLNHINKFNFYDYSILLKGARKFQFENISNQLQLKNHRTVLEINMSALEHNLNYFRSKLNKETKIMIMVKAFSYGSGSFEIANFLQRKKVDYLAVAIADEGIELRKAGIILPILILNPDISNFNVFADYNLEPEIYNFRMLRAFYDAVKNSVLKVYPIHIKLNTGMNRLGFSKNDIPKLMNCLSKMPKVYIKSIFSHLVGAGEKEFDDFTKNQIYTYNSIIKKFEEFLDYSFIKHILNSGGIERFSESQFDMVRLGIGLYGVSSVKTVNLQPISTLKTKIIQIIDVKAGETIGYSRAGKVLIDSKIATIPIGYADGLDRKLSNGVGEVRVNGQMASIIGNICMDLTMIDITGITANEGDEVIIFDEQNTIVDLANKLNTIPYEILTSISQRVKRVYYWE